MPQKPQNLAPAGNVLWQFRHSIAAVCGVPGRERGVAGWASGFPQRAQVGALAGFPLPQFAQAT